MLLEPEAFESCFMSWISSLVHLEAGEIIAIDGKTTRARKLTGLSKTGLHLVSAWAHRNRVVLGQTIASSKKGGGEISAMELLLDELSIEGATITADAMGCQKKIAEKIIKKAEIICSQQKAIKEIFIRKYKLF